MKPPDLTLWVKVYWFPQCFCPRVVQWHLCLSCKHSWQSTTSIYYYIQLNDPARKQERNLSFIWVDSTGQRSNITIITVVDVVVCWVPFKTDILTEICSYWGDHHLTFIVSPHINMNNAGSMWTLTTKWYDNYDLFLFWCSFYPSIEHLKTFFFFFLSISGKLPPCLFQAVVAACISPANI